MKMKKKIQETKRINKEVDSLTLVDYTGLRLPMVTLYHNPIDFAIEGKDIYVARIFDRDRPTNVCVRYKDKDEARNDARNAGFTQIIPRLRGDDAHIVEAYI